MFGTSSQANKLIQAIRDQTEGTPNNMVFVIDVVSVRFGGYFTPQIKACIEQFPYLQMLTLNDCAIKSLDNFPHLPSLIRLDLVFNEITGESLGNLKGSRHLQTLMLGANKIETIEQLQPLTVMKQLLQLDLINNPVSKLPGYRNTIFSMFPTITILDTLDKIGKDAYTSSSMVQAVSRVPDALFDKGPAIPPPAIFAPVAPVLAPLAGGGFGLPKTDSKKKIDLKKSPSKKVIAPIAPTAPLIKTNTKKSVIKKAQPTKSKGKIGAKLSKGPIKASRSVASQSGLMFPVGRIKRRLKETLPGVRVGRNSAIYASAVLEYLSAQLLQIAGNEAKNMKKRRITPECIKNCLKADEQMNNLLKNVTIGLNNEI